MRPENDLASINSKHALGQAAENHFRKRRCNQRKDNFPQHYQFRFVKLVICSRLGMRISKILSRTLTKPIIKQYFITN